MTEDIAALITELEAQEERLQFSQFTNADALALGNLLVSLAVERSHGVTIDITRGDQQLFHVALDGTSADNDDWVARKIRTVRRFGHSSFLIGRRFAATGKDFAESTGLSLSMFAAHGGCFPIIVRDVGPVGTVTVSGLPQADDHALVVEALAAFLAR
ncbi:heme-degrading domain-containing protein [Glaciihabitans sp. dw_435]|uniref:heme-degrading domain-containing protein n=1 Tax=Glaciihabitans sp. dw_435 TaxID=2720081 RepID=UPI001BD4EA91|nr:heme-degrading domain-containing protein [Glaciihabitans sp. dw_435]